MLVLPAEVIANLKCSFCNNYLSVFPIYYENNQKTFVCGRCPAITDNNLQRQIAYEELAKFMKFPCKYQDTGCMGNYSPSELDEHENTCKHRPYFCPLLPLGECPWQGQYHELFEHYQESHPQYVLTKLQIEIDLINNYEEHYIFVHNAKTFLVFLKCNVGRDEFCCCVKNLCPPDGEFYLYKVNLKNDQAGNYELKEQPVQTDDISKLDRNKATYIDICNIKLNLQNPNYVLLNISIKLKNDTTITNSLSKDEEEMLRNIECPVCFLHMVPPVMQCNTGHSICESCKESVKQCPTCCGPIGNTRNFSLETFTSFLKYPCKFREFGCTFVLTSGEIRDHEAECKHGPFSCPIEGCTWNHKLTNLFEHVKESHEDNFLDINLVTFIYNPEDPVNDEETFLITAYGDMFKLYFAYKDETFFWAIQTIGASDGSFKYMFDVNICKGDDSEQIFFRKRCSPLTPNSEALNQGNSYVEISEDMLNNIIEDGTLCYTYSIIKEKN